MAPLYILGESSAGYLLLKATDKHLLKQTDLVNLIDDVDKTRESFKLKKFAKFESAAAALNEAAALSDGKVTPILASLLERLKDEKKASLVVADPKLGNAISKLPNMSITPISDSTTLDIYRALREHLPALVPGLLPEELHTTSLGLSHSLSRHKLKFSPDKVDTMIVQAINLLDDLDKELNMYAMRVKEWYGWHFPEMAKVINDNLAYARIIRKVGMRSNMSSSDLSDILTEDIEAAIKAAAEVSMGTEITEEDLETISSLATQIEELTNYRALLSSYLSSRMQALAPNLTQIVGELVGARLIAHAGSVSNLAKSAGSTIQILGAEKALFRALKTKHDTPKYGLIFHASLVGQATGKNKGKIARMLASKAALGVRIDSMDSGRDVDGNEIPEDERGTIGANHRRHLEWRLGQLEGRAIVGKAPEARAAKPTGEKFGIKEGRKYNVGADGVDLSIVGPKKSKRHGDAMEIDPVNGDDSSSSEDSDSEEEAVATPPPSKLIEEEDDDDSEEEDDSDDEEEMVQSQIASESKSNGFQLPSEAELEKLSKKEQKRLKKEAAKAEEKQRKREEKEAKKAKKKEAKKEAKKAEKEKKRKRESEDGQKKKKKKVLED
jgi:nucleolar protein 58